MTLPEPLEIRRADWNLDAGVLQSTHGYTKRYTTWLRNCQADDFVVRFNFARSPNATQVSVHQSRLLLIDGPLRVLAIPDAFAEGNNREVNLSEEDDATTFEIIRSFLYAMDVDFTTVDTSALLQLVRSAHRWEIPILYESACEFLQKENMLATAFQVTVAKDVSSLPGLPLSFREYFWHRVALLFLSVLKIQRLKLTSALTSAVDAADGAASSKEQVNNDATEETGSLLSTLFPQFSDFWDLALRQDMIPLVFDAILKHQGHRDLKKIGRGLVDCVMQYLEPRMKSDRAVLDLLENIHAKMNLGPADALQLVERAAAEENCSKRAVALLSKAILLRSIRDAK